MDTVGPVEVVIISYPEIGLVPGVSTVLEDFVDNDQLRIADAILVSRGEHGQAVVTDIDDTVAPNWSSICPDPRPLLSADDAQLIVDELGDGSSAVLLVIEHLWPRKLSERATDGGGVVELHARIDPQTVEIAAKVTA